MIIKTLVHGFVSLDWQCLYNQQNRSTFSTLFLVVAVNMDFVLEVLLVPFIMTCIASNLSNFNTKQACCFSRVFNSYKFSYL